MTTRRIVYAGMMTAMYVLLVLVFAPMSFGPIQFRVAGLLQGLALCRPEFAVALGIGNFFANQMSPFGFWDWAIMPWFTWGGAYAAWRLRRIPSIALTVQSVIIAVGVATFPLGLMARLPWLHSFVGVGVSMLIVTSLGYLVLAPAWRYVEQVVVSG